MTTNVGPYRLLVDGFAAERFVVHALTGTEALSEAWSFDVVATASEPDLIEQRALGQRATLIFDMPEKQRAFYGVVAAVRVAEVNPSTSVAHYEFRVVPRLWLLKRKKRTRIFQNMRVHDIVSAVLLEAGIATRWQLVRGYPAREYCTQYEETDYHFVRRLLAEAGIFFYFFGGGPVGAGALAEGAAMGVLAAGASAIGAVAGETIGALAGAAAQMGEALVPGDTVIGADDAACYPPVAGDDADLLAASTAAAMAEGALGGLGVGGGIAGAALGAVSAGVGIATALAGSAAGAPVLHFMRNMPAAISTYDRATRFTLKNRVRSTGAVFREYDPEKPMVRLQSAAVSTQPFPPSPFEIAAAAAAAAENAAGTAANLVGPAAAPLGAVGGAVAAVESAVEDVAAALGAKVPFEVYEHHSPFLFPKWAFASEQAGLILRQKRRRASIAEGEGGCFDFSPGHRFSLEDHPGEGQNGAYVVVRVRHRGEVHPTEKEGWTVYSNQFECAPAEMPYPPACPKRKSVQVSLTATVVGPAGEEIHVNAKGEIRVQFHWDREGRYDDKSSCWIRSMQPWAGAGWGHQFIPRVGMEVVVVFEGGDPDKPMVLGSLYNATHPSPFALPQSKTQSGIRTQSTPGGGGSNELRFEDARGAEEIFIHAERNFTEVVDRDHDVTVLHDEHVAISGSRGSKIDGDESELVRGNTSRGVGKDESIRVEGSRTDVVDGNLEQSVKGALTTRSGSERREINGRSDVTMKDDSTHRSLGCYTTVVGRNEAKRSYVLRVEGTTQLSGSGETIIDSEKGITFRCGKSFIKISPDKIEIAAPSVSAKGEAGGLVADDSIEIRAKESILLSSEKVLLKTPNTSIGMKTDVQIDGKTILLNSPSNATDPVTDTSPPPTKIALKDKNGKALAYQRFLLKLADGSEYSGILDGEGQTEMPLDGSGSITFPDLAKHGPG